jgi:hypothetical protein
VIAIAWLGVVFIAFVVGMAAGAALAIIGIDAMRKEEDDAPA